jgi:hypothetical protein
MINLEKLKDFLLEAKKYGYASGDKNQKIKEPDGSKTIFYERGDWKYHDNYFGGEPYGGREIVFYRNKPVWFMGYYGSIDNTVEKEQLKKIYEFLQECLLRIPFNYPYRGPSKHYEGSYFYENEMGGFISKFYGKETITYMNSRVVYKANYFGGLVNQRNDGIEE